MTHDRKWRSTARVISLIGLVVFVIAASPELAGASTCDMNYTTNGGPLGVYYDGNVTHDLNYGGIEGYLTFDSTESENAAKFLVNYFGSAGSSGCAQGALQGSCSIQAGYGQGTIGGYSSSYYCGSAICPYMEEEDLNGYDLNWDPYIGLTTDNFVTVYYTGQTSTVNSQYGLWDAFIQPAGYASPQLIGQGWLNRYWYLNVYSSIESSYEWGSGTCASVPAYQYFGTDAGGNATAGNKIYVSYNGGYWIPWESLSDQDYSIRSDPPYYISWMPYPSSWMAIGG